MVIGALSGGMKRALAVEAGWRESTESWLDVLLKLDGLPKEEQSAASE